MSSYAVRIGFCRTRTFSSSNSWLASFLSCQTKRRRIHAETTDIGGYPNQSARSQPRCMSCEPTSARTMHLHVSPKVHPPGVLHQWCMRKGTSGRQIDWMRRHRKFPGKALLRGRMCARVPMRVCDRCKTTCAPPCRRCWHRSSGAPHCWTNWSNCTVACVVIVPSPVSAAMSPPRRCFSVLQYPRSRLVSRLWQFGICPGVVAVTWVRDSANIRIAHW